MHIQLRQRDIEASLAQYLKALGMQMPIQAVSFTQSRGKNGAGLVADIELASDLATPETSYASETDAPSDSLASDQGTQNAVSESPAVEASEKDDETEAPTPIGATGLFAREAS